MAANPRPQPALPAFTLDQLAAFGAPGLLYPPPQSIIPNVRSFMSYPYAMSLGHRMLRLDLHVPEGVKGPVPVIVYGSGGGWRMCAKHHSPWLYLLSEGYAVASIEYRLSVEATFPSGVHDVKA